MTTAYTVNEGWFLTYDVTADFMPYRHWSVRAEGEASAFTPHPIVISGHETVDPSGYIARVNLQLCQIRELDGIPLMVSKNLGISNLPDPQPDTMYIVPSMVRSQVPERTDLCLPAKLIRNAHGGVVACSALEVNP